MKTILFADDDRAFREICKRILEDEGYRVVLARGGGEAIDAAKVDRPDVAVLDVHMPLKGGLEAAEQIHAIDPSIPIILYTANDETCTRDHRSCFAAACVEKSSDFTELALAIARVLRPGNRANLSYRIGLNPLPQDQGPIQRTA
jgi:CheY-like chemotaxis protein